MSWSGKGVVTNFNGGGGETLPDMVERAVPNFGSSVWDYSLAPEPDLVIVNLGTNDFSMNAGPTP